MKDAFLAERGIAYRTNEFASGRPTLVFIHGLSGSAAAWEPYEKAFEDRCNVVTFDLRGHGLSARPPTYGGYALEAFTEDVRALQHHLKIEHCILVSHSFGTLIARDLMLAEPERVSAALFLAVPYCLRDTWHQHWMGVMSFARRFAELWPLPLPRGERLTYANLHNTPDWDPRRIVPEIYQMGVRSYLRCLDRQYHSNNDASWTRLRGKIALMHGEKDHFVPVVQARLLAQALPHASLELLPHGNHMLVLNNVAEVTRAIEKLL